MSNSLDNRVREKTAAYFKNLNSQVIRMRFPCALFIAPGGKAKKWER